MDEQVITLEQFHDFLDFLESFNSLDSFQWEQICDWCCDNCIPLPDKD